MSLTRFLRRVLRAECLEPRQVFSATFWIDPALGNDQNDGLSASTALRSLQRIVSQYESLKPADHIQLQPGDTVMLMPGEHNFAYRYGEGQWQGLYLRGVHGTESQPITIRGMPGARLDNRAPDGTEMSSIYLLQSSHIVVEGLEVSSYGSAITVADAHDIAIRDNYIHDVDGIAANNLSGIYLTGVRDTVVERNFLSDNYDRSKPGNANNRHVVIFGGIDVKVLGNTMVNSQAGLGMAVDYKHLGGLPIDAIGSYEVAHNTIIHAAGIAIGTAAPNSHIHHNLLIDSGSIRVADLGGTAQLANERIEFNTIVNTLNQSDGAGLNFHPREYVGYPLGTLQWSHNLVVDYRNYDHPERSTLVVDRYGSDAFFQRVIEQGLLQAKGNVYQTRDSARFDLYGANGGNYGAKGSVVDFATWQAAGFDRHGAAVSLAIDEYFRDQSNSGVQAGIYADGVPRLAATLTRREIDESGENSRTTLRLVRSGADLSSQLVVSISSSQPDELMVPRSVVFPAGVDAISVEITGLPDQQTEPTAAIQLRLQAKGFTETAAWLRLHDSPPDMPSPPPVDNIQLAEGVFRAPGNAGQVIKLQSTVMQRWAEYNNEMGIAYVDDAQGSVGGLKTADPLWLPTLLARGQHHVLLSSGVQAGDTGQVELNGGAYFVFFLVQNNTLSHWHATNPSNQLTGSPLVFTSVAMSNPDQFDHVREQSRGDTLELAWEDLTFGGDNSFMDLVVANRFATVPTFFCPVDSSFPVPPELPLLPIAMPHTWINPNQAADVNLDGQVTALDALLVINAWLQFDDTDLPDYPTGALAQLAMIDTNADSRLTLQDALYVLYEIIESTDRTGEEG